MRKPAQPSGNTDILDQLAFDRIHIKHHPGIHRVHNVIFLFADTAVIRSLNCPDLTDRDRIRKSLCLNLLICRCIYRHAHMRKTFLRCQDLTAHAEAFNTGTFINHTADDVITHELFRAHITDKRLSTVKCNPHLHQWVAVSAAIFIDLFHIILHLDRRCDRILRLFLRDKRRTKYRQNGIAQIFNNGSFMLYKRRKHTLKEIVEYIRHLLRRQPL